jgi:hypothetical protein
MNKDGYDNLQDQLINKTAPGRGYDYHAALPVSNPRPEGKTGKSHGLVALARSDRGGQDFQLERDRTLTHLPFPSLATRQPRDRATRRGEEEGGQDVVGVQRR